MISILSCHYACNITVGVSIITNPCVRAAGMYFEQRSLLENMDEDAFSQNTKAIGRWPACAGLMVHVKG